MSTKVLLVDDHPMFRDGVQQAIARRPGLSVVGEVSTVAAAVKLAADVSPDLILMDVHLPDASGIAATGEILRVLPGAKVIMLTSDANRSLVDQALQAGACGYVWKHGSSGELLRAIEMVLSGRLYISPELSADILADYQTALAPEHSRAKPVLSDRDRNLLKLVASGQRNKEIAVALAVSAKSVEAYRSRLMKKLTCASSAELVRFAIREGIVAA